MPAELRGLVALMHSLLHEAQLLERGPPKDGAPNSYTVRQKAEALETIVTDELRRRRRDPDDCTYGFHSGWRCSRL
ncbi:MAG: hypothetical protein JO019_03210 [Candidatus Kaiserbacteria bacterium]|nr:hypothetical protein [Candidatus Kaiserbacteria bacterium]